MLNASFTYVLQTNAAVAAVMLPQTVGEPFSKVYSLIEEELSQHIAHMHTLFRLDNAAVSHMIHPATVEHKVLATIVPYRCTQNGCSALLGI